MHAADTGLVAAALAPVRGRVSADAIVGSVAVPTQVPHVRRSVGMRIEFDFSKLPGDVALVLSRQQHTQDLADDLARVMSLDRDDRDLIHQEIVGAVAEIVDQYLAGATEPKT
jgi:hypothetical protein